MSLHISQCYDGSQCLQNIINYLPMAKHHIQEDLNLQHKVSLQIMQVVKEWF
jgi:hypothetical protein